MTSIDDIKKMIAEVDQEDQPLINAARHIINIEREVFYGDGSNHNRLIKIQDIIQKSINDRMSDEN